ncbi:hypothetical protein BTN49_1755 [Candidatus Enterovibrio escicola]|uniref:Uncharacterized protein n=1 Tax=Candidatus Enterovibrio escicola TaxID=1927127 RepID=A0A2A5T310_9GAMM|nr:hypothetical protein BTN49_1755 [Candidatus Enterovibrio escacola]
MRFVWQTKTVENMVSIVVDTNTIVTNPVAEPSRLDIQTWLVRQG